MHFFIVGSLKKKNVYFITGLSLEPYTPVLFIMATSKPFNESLETVVSEV